MIRPGDIIAEYFRGIRTDEDGARGVDLLRDFPRFRREDLQVFRRRLVGQADHLVPVFAEDDAAIPQQRGAGDPVARKRGELGQELVRDVGDRIAICRQEHRAGVGVVLGLRQEIRRDKARIGRVIGQDENFARARDGVDADVAEDLPLGFGDKTISRTDDLVDGLDRFRSVRQRRDRLSSTHLVDLRNAADFRRGEDDIGDRGRRRDGDVRDAGRPGGGAGHQERREKRRGAARDINAYAPQRFHDPSESGRFPIPPEEGRIGRSQVVIQDAPEGEFHILQQSRGDAWRFPLEPDRLDGDPVVFSCEFHKRAIAAGAHLVDNARHIGGGRGGLSRSIDAPQKFRRRQN